MVSACMKLERRSISLTHAAVLAQRFTSFTQANKQTKTNFPFYLDKIRMHIVANQPLFSLKRICTQMRVIHQSYPVEILIVTNLFLLISQPL